ncbi:hypothetical protein AwErysi_00610 [Erysipelotrichaceae bacterium]|nr:hypothetical protein AwErysi_00610 [Erysipelotrichaceae bacterium]
MAYMTGYPILGITSNILQLLIVENDDTEFHVLSYYEEPHSAIKDGNLVDANELIDKIKKVYEKTNFFLNTTINDALLVFPDVQATIKGNDLGILLNTEGTEITLTHIRELLRETAKKAQAVNQQLLNIYPISFTVNDVSDIENPQGLIGNSISLKSVSVSVPEGLFMNVLHTIEQSGINVLDIFPAFYCNVTEVASGLNLKTGGNVIDVGYDYTAISIYENGIPKKIRILRQGMKGLADILAKKYQISHDNAYDLLKTSVYLDEKTAEELVVYRLELPTGVLDITEQDLAQTLSAYLEELIVEIRDVLEHFGKQSQFPIIFIGELLKIPGGKEVISSFFDKKEIYFYTSDVVGLREFNVTQLIGCAKLLPIREKLLKQNYETAKTEDIRLEDKNSKKKVQQQEKQKDEKEKKFWDKITTYFFD